jgi:uncharacterized protein (TIGR02284 family)
MLTKTMNLPAKSINWLQDLIQINLDSRDGFREAAENLHQDHNAFEPLFRNLANDRATQADELQELVAVNAEAPQKSGSAVAAAHRAWMDLRTALGGGAKAIMAEAERGEDHIKAKYEEALNDLGNCSCTTILKRHYAAVKASHDTMRDLRDSQA